MKIWSCRNAHSEISWPLICRIFLQSRRLSGSNDGNSDFCQITWQTNLMNNCVYEVYRISSFSFRRNYSCLNLEIVANLNSCHNFSIFDLINWIFGAESIQERKLYEELWYVILQFATLTHITVVKKAQLCSKYVHQSK